MSLPPNTSASRSAASAPRPDPEALLLAAVSQRDRQAAARLAQQWVHRRGVSSLEHFQLEILAPREGTEAFDWLFQLMEDSPLARQGPARAAGHPQGAGSPPLGGASARAIAAVDAAFDALAAEFPQFRLPDRAERPAAAGGPEGATPANGSLEPTAALEGTLVPSPLTSEPFHGERLSADIDLDEPPALLEEPPADLFDDPILFPSPTGEVPVARRFSFEIPQPPAGPAPGPSAAIEARAERGLEPTVESMAEPMEADGLDPLAETAAQDAPLTRLRHRLRRGFSLTRVRTLMRDCLDEAVASLNPPQAGPLEGPTPAGVAEQFAFQDEGVALPSPSAGVSPLATSFAAVEPAVLPAPVLAIALEPTAPAPAFAPLAQASPQAMAQDAAAPLLQAAQLRERLRTRRDETPPAPAPASLSDLRAWLPSVNDLRRAS